MADPGFELYQGSLVAILQSFFEVDDLPSIQAAAREMTFLELKAGSQLFAQGDTTDDVYFVLNGRLRASVQDGREPPRSIGEIMRGETVGELAFLSNTPRSATVAAIRDSILVRMGREQFERFLMNWPRVALAIMRTVVTRFRRVENARQPMKWPITVCILPITAGVDAAGFAQDFADTRAGLGGSVAVLFRADAERLCHAGDGAGAVKRWMDEAEAGSAAVVMVADPGATAWTRTCLAHADEVLLVADAAAAPEESPVEVELFRTDDTLQHARRTLVLLHAPGTASPTGTARWLAGRALGRHFHVRRGDARHLRRVVRILSGRGVGVVLSGGGARGLAHIGALNALAEAGIEPDFIGGTSIGSVIGAWHAMEVTGDRLVAAARAAFVTGGSPVRDYTFPFVSLAAGRKVRRVVEDAIVAATGAAIDVEDTWIGFFCVAANYSTSAEVVLQRGSLAKALLASLAIPGILPPIVLDGHLHVDGGTVNNLPVDVMERFGLGRIIAVDLLVHAVREVGYDWVPSAWTLLLDRLRPRSRRRHSVPGIMEILHKSSFLQSIGRQRDMRRRADVCIAPMLGRVGLLDWSKLDATIESGRQAALEALGAPEAAGAPGAVPSRRAERPGRSPSAADATPPGPTLPDVVPLDGAGGGRAGAPPS